MPSKDYYVILGISPTETQTGVKSAFRDLARQYHPDRAGAPSTPQFQEIAEAYRVLGDRVRRAAYDASRDRAVEATVGPARHRGPVEPLDPGPAAHHRNWVGSAPAHHRFSVLDDFLRPYSAHDGVREVFERSFRNFPGMHWPKSGRAEYLNLALALAPEDAMRGADVRLAIPVLYPCRSCRGTGHAWLHPCTWCGGDGTEAGEEDVTVRVPPGVPDGAVLEVPVDALGIRSPRLRLMIRVVAGRGRALYSTST